MPPWIGPVTIGLGTVGLSTSRCDPAAGPLPLELPSARALPAVSSPAATAIAAIARPPGRHEFRPDIEVPSRSGTPSRRPGRDYVARPLNSCGRPPAVSAVPTATAAAARA